MKNLPEEFDQKGFSLKILKRSADIALLEKTHKISKGKSYEVVIVQKRKAATFPNGKTTEAHEAMPASEKWGEQGWSQPTLEKAELRFKRQVEAQDS